MSTKYIHISNGRKIDQMVIKYAQQPTLQDPPKFTQILIFGLKICHLATLVAIFIYYDVYARAAACVTHRGYVNLEARIN
jgi:hypothetical protein